MSIEIRGVSYAIDGSPILDDVSLEMESGMFGLIGPNGAGKTTLLRVISGYIQPDKGEVLLDGAPVGGIGMKERARKMALVPQNYALDYDFTVLETVLMGRNPHKKAFEADTAADLALARESIRKAGIAQLENRSILGLSGGEWQRMVIARALCQQSSVLLLDEPVSSLDIRHQVGIMETVGALTRERGLLCVAVLHDLNLTYRYCNRIALMKKGRVVAVGAPKDVMQKKLLEEVYGTKIDVFDHGAERYIFPARDAK